MLGPAAPPRQEAFRLCGSAIPPAFISARDHVWIFFHSDASSSGQAQGFRLSYIRGDTSNRAPQGATEHSVHHGGAWARAAPSTCPLPAGSPPGTPSDQAQWWDGDASRCCLRVPWSSSRPLIPLLHWLEWGLTPSPQLTLYPQVRDLVDLAFRGVFMPQVAMRGQGLLLFLGPAETPLERGSHPARSWPSGPLLEEALLSPDCLPLRSSFRRETRPGILPGRRVPLR